MVADASCSIAEWVIAVRVVAFNGLVIRAEEEVLQLRSENAFASAALYLMWERIPESRTCDRERYVGYWTKGGTSGDCYMIWVLYLLSGVWALLLHNCGKHLFECHRGLSMEAVLRKASNLHFV